MIEPSAVDERVASGSSSGEPLGMEHGRRGGWAVRAHAVRPVQNLRDVNELDGHADALCTALLMHETGGVGRDDVLGAGARVIGDLVVAHLGGHDLFEDREGAAEAAAFVRSRRCRRTRCLRTFESRSIGLEK